jgi:succinate dehydrogenase assembly factor 2
MAFLVYRTALAIARKTQITNTAFTLIRNGAIAESIVLRPYSTDSAETSVDESFLPRPVERLNEALDVKRARLLYQSRKRGILETDLLLSTFAAKHLSTMPVADMQEYDKVSCNMNDVNRQLLDEPDWDIYYWATLKKPTPEEWRESKILSLLKEHVKNEGKAILRMPDLSG